MQFKNLAADTASEWLQQGHADFVDIRDPQSFGGQHIRGARHLDNDSLQVFLQQADRMRPLVVCCYHGVSSQSAAQFLAEQGFQEVYSLDGGFEFWRNRYPEFCE